MAAPRQGPRWLVILSVLCALAFDLPARDSIDPNLQLIGAPQAWAHGATGRGVVVAVLDSGVDMTAPELAVHWRGGPHGWFDPYGQHNSPMDASGHGTQMLGIIVSIAPEARWMAARIFDDRGHATTAAIHAALRWALDPDNDPTTDDTPDVLNASWTAQTLACDSEFAADLRALRAAGILPVFAAGTQAPLSPATLPEAFAVGALDSATRLTIDSPHGPSPCGGLFPQLIAPGAGIRTVDRFGLSTTVGGTSAAAAHVSGALALVLSARPGLTTEQQATLLRESAADLGPRGPDDAYGFGRLNVGAAVARLQSPEHALAGIGAAMALVLIGSWWVLKRSRSS